MTAKILGTKKDPFSVNALENYAMKYIFHPYISFNIRFNSITCHIYKSFSVLFGGKSPFLSLVGPMLFGFCLINDQMSSSHTYRSPKQMGSSTRCPRITILVGLKSYQISTQNVSY